MRLNTINSYNIFPTLKLILKDEIVELQKLANTQKNGPQFNFFILSLIDAKKKIVNLIPIVNNGVGTVPSLALMLHQNKSKYIVSDNEVQILNAVLESEKAQRRLIRNASISFNMPSKLKQRLKKILSVYENIIDQLNRSKSTQQMSAIVV